MFCDCPDPNCSNVKHPISGTNVISLAFIKNANRTHMCLYSSLCCPKVELHWVICSGRFPARLLKLCEPEQMAQITVLWYIQRRVEHGDAPVFLWAVQNKATNYTCLLFYYPTYSKYAWPPAYVQGSLWLRSLKYRDINSLPQSIFLYKNAEEQSACLCFSLRYPISKIC